MAYPLSLSLSSSRDVVLAEVITTSPTANFDIQCDEGAAVVGLYGTLDDGACLPGLLSQREGERQRERQTERERDGPEFKGLLDVIAKPSDLKVGKN